MTYTTVQHSDSQFRARRGFWETCRRVAIAFCNHSNSPYVRVFRACMRDEGHKHSSDWMHTFKHTNAGTRIETLSSACQKCGVLWQRTSCRGNTLDNACRHFSDDVGISVETQSHLWARLTSLESRTWVVSHLRRRWSTHLLPTSQKRVHVLPNDPFCKGQWGCGPRSGFCLDWQSTVGSYTQRSKATKCRQKEPG